MDNNVKTVYKIFLFSLLRIDRITDYLNEMLEKGYRLKAIRLGFVFIFEQSNVKDGYRYTILTKHWTRGSGYFKEKWNDEIFLEKRNPRFFRNNGEQCDYLYYFLNTWSSIYLTRVITDEDIVALREYRKTYFKYLVIYEICALLFILFLLALFCYSFFD